MKMICAILLVLLPTIGFSSSGMEKEIKELSRTIPYTMVKEYDLQIQIIGKKMQNIAKMDNSVEQKEKALLPFVEFAKNVQTKLPQFKNSIAPIANLAKDIKEHNFDKVELIIRTHMAQYQTLMKKYYSGV